MIFVGMIVRVCNPCQKMPKHLFRFEFFDDLNRKKQRTTTNGRYERDIFSSGGQFDTRPIPLRLSRMSQRNSDNCDHNNSNTNIDNNSTGDILETHTDLRCSQTIRCTYTDERFHIDHKSDHRPHLDVLGLNSFELIK